MKNIILVLAALIGGSSATYSSMVGAKPGVSVEQSSSHERLGQDAISQIRKDYEEGRYDTFLKEIDSSYAERDEKNELSGLANFRKGIVSHPKWKDAAQLMSKEKNEQLLELVGDDSSFFAQKIKSAATLQTTPEQEQAIIHLAQFRQMAPHTGQNSDENKLIDLDLEYEYKSIHLDMPYVNGEPAADRREKHYVLKMDHANRLLVASQSFKDATLKKDVELYAKNLDDRLAQNWDQNDLSSLINGKVKPADPLQEKAALILELHQEKISDLTKQMLSHSR